MNFLSTGERLRQLWEFTKDRSNRIIDAIKEDSDAAGITKKLQEARDLIEQRATEAKELGRSKLLEVLGSDEFETILSKLPEETQEKIRQEAEDLKKALENGVETPAVLYSNSKRMTSVCLIEHLADGIGTDLHLSLIHI